MCQCFCRHRAGDGGQVGQQAEVDLDHQTEPSAPPLVRRPRPADVAPTDVAPTGLRSCANTSLIDYNRVLSLRFPESAPLILQLTTP